MAHICPTCAGIGLIPARKETPTMTPYTLTPEQTARLDALVKSASAARTNVNQALARSSGPTGYRPIPECTREEMMGLILDHYEDVKPVRSWRGP